MIYAVEKREAITAVVCAAALSEAVRMELGTAQSFLKGDRSPVTVADLGSQALVCRHLATSLTQDPIVAEEDASALRDAANGTVLALVTRYVQRFAPHATAEEVCRWIDLGRGAVADRFWTLDPIDGTDGFLRGEQYAIALALIEQGRVQVAVLGCPALPLRLDGSPCEQGVLFVAVRGEGASMAALGSSGFVTVRVLQDPPRSHLRLVESVELRHGNAALQETVARAVRITQPPLRMDSQAKYGIVARGDAALYLRLPSPDRLDYRERIWDHAAGALIVEEAGGRVTDMRGQPLDMASGERMRHSLGVVVSNGSLHEAVLRALADHVSLYSPQRLMPNKEEEMEDQDTIAVVSGLPRSGTSMMMSMLEAGGMPVLTDNARAADEDNPRGYYEFERVKQLEQDDSWLQDARGKVVKVVSQLLPHLPQRYAYRVIFMRREMAEVLASQREMLVRRGRPTNRVSDEQLAAIYDKHLRQVERWIEGQPNVAVLYVDYAEVLEHPLQQARRVSQFLGTALDVQAMAGVVDESLYRQRG